MEKKYNIAIVGFIWKALNAVEILEVCINNKK